MRNVFIYMHRLFSLAFFIIVLLASFGIADAEASSTPQVIKLQRFRKALWTVRVTVKGKEGDFLFDTGGGVTLLTESFLNGIECKFWGRTTGYNMFGGKASGPHCDNVEMRSGGVLLSKVSVGKFDFGDRFPGSMAPDGILSLDAFDGKAITIDQTAATITIETPKSLAKRILKATEMSFRISRECSSRCLSVFAGVPTSAGMTWLTLDSGAGGVSLISKDHATLFNLDPDAKDQRLKHLAAPGIPIDSPVMVTEMIMDGNLGQPFLSQYVVTLDLKNSRMWIKPNDQNLKDH